TFSLVPKGSERWAAVSAEGFMRSPEAVLEFSAYQEARPHWARAGDTEVATIRPAMAVAAKKAVRLVFFMRWVRVPLKDGPLSGEIRHEMWPASGGSVAGRHVWSRRETVCQGYSIKF